MSNLQTRLRELRKGNNLTQSDMAKLLREKYHLKTDRVMISKWETGFQTPEVYTITCIADLFGVTMDYLNGKERKSQKHSDIYKNLPEPNITESYTTFPVIGEVAAGYECIAVEDWEGECIDIPDKYLSGHNRSDFFVLKVKGDSMYPQYQHGDKVLVLKQSTMDYSGQIGVVIYGDDLGTLKRVEYSQGEDWMKLVPVNPNHPTVRIENEDLEHCRVLGIPRLLIREIND